MRFVKSRHVDSDRSEIFLSQGGQAKRKKKGGGGQMFLGLFVVLNKNLIVRYLEVQKCSFTQAKVLPPRSSKD